MEFRKVLWELDVNESQRIRWHVIFYFYAVGIIVIQNLICPTLKIKKIFRVKYSSSILEWFNRLQKQKITVIGGGATAVTIVPEIAKEADHVVMIQRSPTYVVSRPSEDAINKFLRRFLPIKLTYFLIRWKNILFQSWTFFIAGNILKLQKINLYD